MDLDPLIFLSCFYVVRERECERKKKKQHINSFSIVQRRINKKKYLSVSPKKNIYKKNQLNHQLWYIIS